MTRYHLSLQAGDDLGDIWFAIATDNVSAADRFVDQLIARFRVVAQNPGFGRPRPELAAELRSVPVGDYLIFYRFRTDAAEIVRVLHGSRDLPSLPFNAD